MSQDPDEIADLIIKLIVITGDLTDVGLTSQFERASGEIKKLTDICLYMIVTLGNPDYRHTLTTYFLISSLPQHQTGLK